jgi:hypothetical protein
MAKKREIKRRYNAKAIARSPALKKQLAEFLASHSIEATKTPMVEILAYGHRGYISYSEDELCKKFDLVYTDMLARIRSIHDRIVEFQAKHRTHQWEMQRLESELKEAEKQLATATEISHEIFEERFLV